MSAISSKTTVAQCYLGPISSNRKVVHGVFYRFWHPNNTGKNSSKTTVAQSVLTRILSNRTIAHGVLDNF